MKANFKVDPDFPIIDGIGHSDQIDFFNVKGGGSTNTTLFDGGYDGFHVFTACRSPVALGTDLMSCRVDPNLVVDGNGVFQAVTADCLNSVPVGDTAYARCSDRVLLNRIEVSGSFHRAGGTDGTDSTPPGAAPKVFVCVVLDTQSNGATVSSGSMFDIGNSVNSGATNFYSGVPLFDPVGPFNGALPDISSKRCRVLAYDVIDFALNPETRFDYVVEPDTLITTGGPLPVPTESIFTSSTRYGYWRPVSLGFRFDVDLNDALCCYLGDVQTIVSCADLSLHVYAVVFDGSNLNGYTPHAFGTLSMSYTSRLYFVDFLIARAISLAPGADGDVVPDDEVPLTDLADQSALMAGDGTFLDAPHKRRHTKASTGHFNFRPKNDPVLMHFPDDPEVARMPAPGWRGSGNPSRPKKLRSRGQYPDRDRPFDDFLGDDWNDPRRGF